MPLSDFPRLLAQQWSHRLAFRLQVWVLMAGLPSLAVGAALAGVLYHMTIVSTERSVELAARQAMETLDRLMFERYGDVEVFASLPAVRTLDRDNLQAVANLYVSTYAPYYALAAIADRSGAVLAVSDAGSTGPTPASAREIGLSVSAEPWFLEALAHPQQVVFDDGPRDRLTQAVAHDGKAIIVLARAISNAAGTVVGVWSAHIVVESLVHVFQPMGRGADKSVPYPMVLKAASGERLLAIGVSENAPPDAIVRSSGFSRWPGGRWTLEAYMPSQFRRQQWMLAGWGGMAIMLFTATGTAVLAWIFRREVIRPLADLESQVLMLEVPPHRAADDLMTEVLAHDQSGASSQERLLRRDDELGDLARKLHAQTREIHVHLSQLSLLNHSSRGIQEHVVSLPALLERILHTAKLLTGARYAALGVFDETGERLIQFLTAGIDDETRRAIGPLPTGRGLLGAVIKKDGVLRLKDLTRHAESVGFPAHHPAMQSFLGVSIRARGTLFGRLYLTDKLCAPADGFAERTGEPATGEFTELDEQLVAALAFQAGTAIETARLIEEIRATQSRDRALLDSVDEGIYGVDLAGRCLFINRAGAAMLGHAPSDLVGRDMHAAVHHTREDGTPCPDTACPILGALRAQHGCRLEQERFWRQDGTSFPAICAVTLLRGEDDAVTGAVVCFSDLTERRAMETRVRQGQKMETLGQLAAGVAHDFNNLLTVMAGYSELALLQADAPASVRAKVEEIKKAADRAAVLTGQLLAFGRKKPVERKVVSVTDAIRGVESLIRRLAGEGITVDIALPDGRWFIKADVGGFEQILINLVVNARDAMPNGGRLEIRGAILDPAAASPALMQAAHGSSIMLTVRDTGVGMDKATQARIFEPFFTTKSVGRGTGLGLATVYRIVMEHDGGIYVASEPGAGTTFTVVFPLVEAPVEQAPAAGGEGPVRGGDETVLLVEDEASVQALATSMLESRGYRVLTAQDGQEGVAVAQQYEGPIHLLVSDARMPRVSGPAMARRLRSQRPALKVLFITGSLDAGRSGYGALSKQGHVLRKPFTMQALLEAVRQVLDLPASRREVPNEAGEPARVLIIDDDAQINALLQEMLRSESFPVLAAASGAEGIERLQQEPVDVALVDLSLPDMDGVLVIQAVQQRWPLVKILAMSGGGIGVTPDVYLARARQAGAAGTLVKPFSREQLIEAVHEVIADPFL
ncbi:MAG: response regulator [Nitrospira sp.]|nr:response regulator [Nitrospira sp.]